ncbi:Fur family transcriptional regulator [Microbulbifer harenosus]|uniref:Transcriptional repressor n=1 Tax=Microbulbifer harenosus TaxID=2576840 RepID=A0ABY2UJ14_9GAMM|nr:MULTISPECIES: Fur family transcriptional regulator [Microbulbifer]QIL90300.1 transcriptional repressor [Microbulbifer sp. SH-1]TLM78139.1 transcriptional repressor [Microbulbifer harenosus]
MKASQLKRTLGAAEQSCRTSGARLTEKRKNVLAILLRSKTPLSAYEIAEQYGRDYGESIPAMSVYRMLDFLAEENLAHKLNSENKYLACAHIACDHSHQTPQFLICSRCNKVREIGIKPEVIAALRETVEGAGYRLQTSQLELDCLCDDCAERSAA